MSSSLESMAASLVKWVYERESDLSLCRKVSGWCQGFRVRVWFQTRSESILVLSELLVKTSRRVRSSSANEELKQPGHLTEALICSLIINKLAWEPRRTERVRSWHFNFNLAQNFIVLREKSGFVDKVWKWKTCHKITVLKNRANCEPRSSHSLVDVISCLNLNFTVQF